MKHALTSGLGLCALAISLAGPARAEGIEITGAVSMGLVGGSGQAAGDGLRLANDLDLRLRWSHQTDGGLTLAIELDLDDLPGTEAGSATHSPGIPRRR